MDVARRLDHISSAGNGALARPHLKSLGLSDMYAARRVATGEWVRSHAGVFVPACVPVTRDQQLTTAVLAAGPHSFVSHRTSAIEHGVQSFRSDIVELTVPYAKGPTPAGVVVHRSRADLEPWVVTVDGIRMADLRLTLLQVAGVVPAVLFERSVDIALGRKLVTVDELARTVIALCRRGRKGSASFRRAIAARADEADAAGVLEAFGATIARSTLPTLTPEYVIYDDDGVFVARVDFARLPRKLAIELDGFETHAQPKGFQRDHDKRHALRRAGWDLLEFTYDDVKSRPEWVVEQIAAEL